MGAADEGSKQGAVTAAHRLVKGSKGETKLGGDNRKICLATSYIQKVAGLRRFWQFAFVLPGVCLFKNIQGKRSWSGKNMVEKKN